MGGLIDIKALPKNEGVETLEELLEIAEVSIIHQTFDYD